jgi:hypothetical protein
MISGNSMKYFHDVEQVFPLKLGRNRTRASHPLTPVYRVGEPFRQGRCCWPEGAYFSYSPGGHELSLFHSDIREGMVNEVSRGQAEFAMIVEPPLLVLAYRFGQSIPWDDVPYSWHLQPVDWRRIPSRDHSPESRALLWISLVGANDGIIHAQRGMTLSPGFTRTLHDAIRTQALMAFDAEECTLAISRVFLNYPSTVDRLSLAVARTLGNE